MGNEIVDASHTGDSSGTHGGLISHCNREMSKLIKGSTLANDNGDSGGASYKLGEIHDGVRWEAVQYDADHLQEIVRRHLFAPSVAFNGLGAAPPLLKVQVVRDITPRQRAEIAEDLGRWRHRQPRDAEGYRGWSMESDDAEAPVLARVIADASSDWQDADRARGKNSFDKLRARGWRWICKPDENTERNPEIMERVKTTNALLKNHAGDRRMFSVRGNERFNRAMRCWEMRDGIPYKAQRFRPCLRCNHHPVYRFYGCPRVRTIKKGDYRGVGRSTRQDEFRGT